MSRRDEVGLWGAIQGEAAALRHHSRSWEPPPQSLRDSSPAGGAIPDPFPNFAP